LGLFSPIFVVFLQQIFWLTNIPNFAIIMA